MNRREWRQSIGQEIRETQQELLVRLRRLPMHGIDRERLIAAVNRGFVIRLSQVRDGWFDDKWNK